MSDPSPTDVAHLVLTGDVDLSGTVIANASGEVGLLDAARVLAVEVRRRDALLAEAREAGRQQGLREAEDACLTIDPFNDPRRLDKYSAVLACKQAIAALRTTEDPS